MSDHVTPADRQRYRDFVASQISTFGKPPPTTILWHYTNGELLIKIIETGTLFSTQIACVNDSTEYRYSVELVHQACKRIRRRFPNHPDTAFLLDYIDTHISTDTSTNEWFITCFSTNRDDLSQWRAYGNGENGYAIGFNGPKMIGSVHRNQCLLVPVNYDQSTHIRIADAIAEATVRFFLEGWKVKQSPALNIHQWAESFLTAWVDDITYLAPAMKHPGFSTENPSGASSIGFSRRISTNWSSYKRGR